MHDSASEAGTAGADALAAHGASSGAPAAEIDADEYEYESADTAPAAPEPLSATIPQALAGERLDKAIAQLFPDFSRSRLQSWIESGRVTVDGEPARIRSKVPRDALVVVTPDLLPEQLAFTPEPLALDILYEDATLMVVNKPAGMVVHPAAGNWSGTLLNGLLHRYRDAAGLPRAGIVHRLDKETSGLMVVARSLTAQTDLVRQLQARTVKRRYIALVWGTSPASGLIDAPIGRDPRDRLRMAIVHGATGKPARTHFETVATGLLGEQPVSVVQCDLETGRTHQIRVHFAHLGHPLLGDPLYGRARSERSGLVLPGGFARQALHAWRLGLVHPATGAFMAWRVDVPADLALLAEALGVGDALLELGEDAGADEPHDAVDDFDDADPEHLD
jgi:23S rRNA pseudouridine1911/1915/1917 synthase